VLRTVTFSDKAVADRVNLRFVPAWCNRGPGFRNTDAWSEQRIFAWDLEAYPTKNICTFFLTPEGRVFHYVAGSYSPGFFQRILDDAEALRTAMFDEAMRPRAGYLEAAMKVRMDRAADFQDLAEQIRQPEAWSSMLPDRRDLVYRGKRHAHSSACGRALEAGYGYLSRLHAVLAGWTDLPALEDVRYRYEYGNEFTEESADARRIDKPEDSRPAPLPRMPRATAVTARGLGLGLPSLDVAR
jgi:hypothetical protein